MDITQVLKQEHDKVNALFMQVKQMGSNGSDVQQKEALFLQIMQELTIHTLGEEQLVYPRLEQDGELKPMAAEARDEHAEAKQMLLDISNMDASSPDWDQKFESLVEAIKHHVEEEENEVFPKMKEKFESAELAAMAQSYIEFKDQQVAELEDKPSSARRSSSSEAEASL